MSYFW